MDVITGKFIKKGDKDEDVAVIETEAEKLKLPVSEIPEKAETGEQVIVIGTLNLIVHP